MSEDTFVLLLPGVLVPNILQCTGLSYSSNPPQSVGSDGRTLIRNILMHLVKHLNRRVS